MTRLEPMSQKKGLPKLVNHTNEEDRQPVKSLIVLSKVIICHFSGLQSSNNG